MSKKLCILLILSLLVGLLPAAAQEDVGCGRALAPRLEVGKQGKVATNEGFYLNVRAEPGLSVEPFIRLARGEVFDVVEGPRCLDNIAWWSISQFGLTGWIAEYSGNDYLVDPHDPAALPTLPPPVVHTPLDLTNDLPAVTLAPNPDPLTLQTDFVTWDWARFMEEIGSFYTVPDPLAVTLPEAYLGDIPEGPFDLSDVRFVEDANLNPAQLAALAANGFVVVPGGMDQFEEVYRWDENWSPEDGHAYWVTTDSVLHALHVVFDNMLQFLEQEELYGRVLDVVTSSYSAAEQQLDELADTESEAAARNAAVYYAVALALLESDTYAETVREDIRAEADPLVALALAGEGRLAVPFLPGYEEDFSQYTPRGHYAGVPELEHYFRAMTWLGRITFLARDDDSLRTSLLALRALQTSGRYNVWEDSSEVLAFLIGPTDNLGPAEYLPLAQEIFGVDLPPQQIAADALLADFRAAVQALPGPRINNVVRPVGTEADELDEATRGFRLFGQRFTLDAYAMQRLIYPYVGEVGDERTLPSGLDVAAALGSDIAYALLRDRGDTAYANYDTNMAALREEMSQIEGDGWLQNVYGAWLWALQPLWARDPEIYPALMNSQSWLLRDLHAGLGSYTELKHDTLLYTAQPMGGLGGGGERIANTDSTVEPNPLVFSRVSLAAAAVYEGLRERDMDGAGYDFETQTEPSALNTVLEGFKTLAVLSAQLTEMARKELWGEPLTEDEQLFLKYNFGDTLWYVRYFAELPLSEPPKVAALVADVASNPDSGEALQLGTGQVDYIYVITDSPEGLQLVRGSVFSFYEFTTSIDNRLTDDEWRAAVAAGTTPPRPDWVRRFYVE